MQNRNLLRRVTLGSSLRLLFSGTAKNSITRTKVLNDSEGLTWVLIKTKFEKLEKSHLQYSLANVVYHLYTPIYDITIRTLIFGSQLFW